MFQRQKVSALYPNVSVSTAADRRAVRKAARVRAAQGFEFNPDPHLIGDFQRGKQLIAGHYQFGGSVIDTTSGDLWGQDAPDLSFEIECQGFTWLDDLAAVGDVAARELSQSWLQDWIKRYGDGSGPGWSADIVGRRALRLLDHSQFLQIGQDGLARGDLLASLTQHTEFLATRWRSASDGVARFEALSALLFAGLTLKGLGAHVPAAVAGLGAECDAQIEGDGGMAHRNPEALMEVFALLTHGAVLLARADMQPNRAHEHAMERMVPTLRALRHSDGSLARFHGSGLGAEGRLDTALGDANIKSGARSGLSMGYLRMSGGRTSVIVDAAAPPKGHDAAEAHASTLGFEMASGFQPMVVNYGAGTSFGMDWRRAGRKTTSHSALVLNNTSSSVLVQNGLREDLTSPPSDVQVQPAVDDQETWFEGFHTGYVPTCGLIHTRRMALSYDGFVLTGEDKLDPAPGSGRKQFERAIVGDPLAGLPFEIRFHLHPDVKATINPDTADMRLELKSGENWMFKAMGRANIALTDSVFLQKGRMRPLSSKQIVLTGRVMEYAIDVSWSFSRLPVRS